MHSFHFTRVAHMPGVEFPENGKRRLHVAINHNGDWSGHVMIQVVAAPPHLDNAAADRWYFKLDDADRAAACATAEVPATLLLNGDVDPEALPWLVARVLGAIVAESVARYLCSRMVSAIDSIGLPKRST